MIIGITGKSGAGKSYLAKLVAEFGLDVEYIDIDEIGHNLLDEYSVASKIQEKLGIKVSSTNRKELADTIFKNRNGEMKIISDIMWETMRERIGRRIGNSDKKHIVLDWILLPHTDLFKRCDVKILVKPCDEELRKEKVCKRDNITEEKLNLRDSASIKYNEADFDYVVINNYNS